MSLSLRRVAISAAISAAVAVTGIAGIAAPSMGQTTSTTAPASPGISLDVRAVGKLGNVMVDGKGLTLYMFTPDRPNISNCEGQCLNVWPPVMLEKGQTLASVKLDGGLRRSKLGVAMRFDGSQQLTYNGWPLYYWVQDKVPGDVKGQWVQNIWFVLDHTGTPVSDRA
jgi:predicted lipoprotein with Yx(FWY)xxD motif